MRSLLFAGRSFSVKLPKFRFAPGSTLLLAFLLLMFPLPWISAWLAAAAIHELGHCIAVRAFGRRILFIQISPVGAVIRSEELGPLPGAVCSLAGPIFGASLILLANIFPRLSLCAAMQTVCNLIPVPPLDGGQAAKDILIYLLGEQRGRQIANILFRLNGIALLSIGLWAAFVWNIGVLPVLGGVFLFIKTKNIKIPCKQRLHKVQ